MLRINLEVTKTPTHLEQIKEVVVVNIGDPLQQINVPYQVYLGGDLKAFVSHTRSDGALALAHKALGALVEAGGH